MAETQVGGRRLGALSVVLAAAVAGCSPTADGETEGGPGSADPGIVLLVAPVPTAACDTVGATVVQWQATRIGCVEGPPAPCTLPAEPRPAVGDRFDCPRTDPTVLLGVELETPGRYQAEALVELTAAPAESECYRVEGGLDFVVTEDMIAAGTLLMAEPSGRGCP